MSTILMNTLLIENVTIITLGGGSKILKDYSVLIRGGLIDTIAPSGELDRTDAQVLDGRGRVLLPGFINTHMHFYSSFARGLVKAKPASNFSEILENLWWRLDKRLELEDVYFSARVAMLEAIRHGTTTLVDHHASPYSIRGSLEQILKAAGDSGLRTAVCYEVSDRDGPDIARQGIEENEWAIKTVREDSSGMFQALFGLHAAFTLSDETLRECQKSASSLGAGFHVHVAEGPEDQALSLKEHQKRVVSRLHDFGITGPGSIFAHCVHVDKDELELIQKTDTMVVHNPQSNMNNAVGVADINAMLEKGVLVGLGTDAMTTNMLEELRSGIWIQKLQTNDPGAGFAQCVQLLTENNAKIYQRLFGHQCGLIQPGARADLILIDYDPFTQMTAENFAGHLVFGLSQSSVSTTICDGKILMDEGRILNQDQEEIYGAARNLSQKLWERF